MTQLLSGCGSTLYMNSFRSKGDALKFAIEFTSSVLENKVNYDAAQELFDFICRNVPLPDVDPTKQPTFSTMPKPPCKCSSTKTRSPKQ